jgi:ribonuclease M5
MIRLKEAVIVEGRYDKIKLMGLLDALIIPTHGYRIFKDKKALAMIRQIGLERGLIILTDSDAAGFRIRRRLQGYLPADCIRHVYLPQIAGREPRKKKPSAEGLLGVEGVDDALLLKALKDAGVRPIGEDAPPAGQPITRADLVVTGLSGAADSGTKRQRLLAHLSLPSYLTAKALPATLSALMDREAFINLCRTLFEPDDAR